MKLIKFTLSAPLQSWGEDARWDQRTTASMPSKSAIIGLFGSCLGFPRGDDRLNRLASMLNIAVRADRPGRVMTDFHTVQGTNGFFINAEGKPRTGSNTIITPKQYLQDARFTVFVWGDETTLEDCFAAMHHPRWFVYLGRKSCVPAVPLIPIWVDASAPEEAVSKFTEDEKKHSEPIVHVEMDVMPGQTSDPLHRMYIRRDTLVRADRNEYTGRWVKVFTVASGGE